MNHEIIKILTNQSVKSRRASLTISSRNQRRTARCPRRTRLSEGTSARAMTTSPNPTPICPTAATATRLPSPPRTIEGYHRHHNLRFSRKLDKGEGRKMDGVASFFKWKGALHLPPTSLPHPSHLSYFLFDVWVSYPSLLSLCMRARKEEVKAFSLLPSKPCLNF